MNSGTIRFDNRVAIITGGGGGLGRAYALELARRGARVVVNDLGGPRDGSEKGTVTAADRVVDEIRAMGAEAAASYDTVTTPDGGEKIIQTALEAFGKVDILINNAGILRDKSFLKMEPENWQAVLAVHLDGAFHVTRPAFREMRANGFGRIIMTTSSAGLYGNFGQANYSAAKMALVGLMNTLKLEGQKYNITVNTVAPMAGTRMTEGIIPPDIFKKMKPELVAPLVLYLCSEECNETGAIYNAGMGFFNRAAVLTGPGVQLGGEENPPTAELVRENWDRINTLEGAKAISDATAATFSLVSPPGQGQEKKTNTNGTP